MELSLNFAAKGMADSVMVPFPPGYGQISQISVPGKMAQMVKTYLSFFVIFNTVSFPEISTDTIAGVIAKGLKDTLEIGVVVYLKSDAEAEKMEKLCRRNIVELGAVKQIRKELLDGMITRIQDRVVECTRSLFGTVLRDVGRLYRSLDDETFPENERDAACILTDFVIEIFENYQARILATPEKLAEKVDGEAPSRKLHHKKKGHKAKLSGLGGKAVAVPKAVVVSSITQGAGGSCSAKVTEEASSSLFIKTFYAMAVAKRTSHETVLHPRVETFVRGSIEEALFRRKREVERRGGVSAAYSESEVVAAHAIPDEVLQTVFQEGFGLYSEKTAEGEKIKCCITKNGEKRILESTTMTKKGKSVLYHFVNRVPRGVEEDWFKQCEEAASDDCDWFDVVGFPYQMDSRGNHRYVDRDSGDVWIFHRKLEIV
jgi:hypothetical protein